MSRPPESLTRYSSTNGVPPGATYHASSPRTVVSSAFCCVMDQRPHSASTSLCISSPRRGQAGENEKEDWAHETKRERDKPRAGAVASRLGLLRDRAVGFIDWLDLVLLSNDSIGPLDQRNEDLRITKLCAVFGEICFGNSASARTSPTRVDRYLLTHQLPKNFGKRWPANWDDRICD